MKLGDFEVTAFVFGTFRLDGGSMFGSVPKTLWQRVYPPDADNCIPLVARSLLIRRGDMAILIDTGMGEKWSDKERAIFAIANVARSALPIAPDEVTDLVLTHLHFDHAGGSTERGADGVIQCVYPRARVYLQKSNLDNARSPTVKERASYRAENFEPLANDRLRLIDGETEIIPGLIVHRADGHTRGQQWIEVRGGDGNVVFFPTDVVPTSRHVPLAYHMGYDTCAETILKDKEELLARAVNERATVVFQHDPDVAAARIVRDEKGGFAVGESVPI